MCGCVYTDGMPGSSRGLTDVGACGVMTHYSRTNSVNVNTDKAYRRAIPRETTISHEGTRSLGCVGEQLFRK